MFLFLRIRIGRKYRGSFYLLTIRERFGETTRSNNRRIGAFELSLIATGGSLVAIDGRGLIGMRNRTHDRPLTHVDQTVSPSLSQNRGTCRRDNFGGTPQLWRMEQNSDFVEALSPIGGGTRACRSKPRAESSRYVNGVRKRGLPGGICGRRDYWIYGKDGGKRENFESTEARVSAV